MRDEVITGGKTRGCWSPRFQLPWKHVRPVEGWELSAVEGGGGTREKGEEWHISWRALLTAPRLPKAAHPNQQALRKPLLDWGWVRARWRTQCGHVFVHTRPWQAL